MDYVLKHHGIKGQKWGVRRFQNEDGTRTAAGKKRYSDQKDEQDDPSSFAGGGGDEPEELTEEEIDELLKSDQLTKNQKKNIT